MKLAKLEQKRSANCAGKLPTGKNRALDAKVLPETLIRCKDSREMLKKPTKDSDISFLPLKAILNQIRYEQHPFKSLQKGPLLGHPASERLHD